MRKLIVISLLFFGATLNSNAQCGDELIRYGKTQLEDATYISDYKVLLPKSKKKNPAYKSFKIKLEKNKLYRFVISTDIENKNPLIATLTDDYNKYASSYNNIDQTDKGGFDFLCKKTQIYYLTCYYKNGTEGCGAVLFSYVKTYSKF
jgi:hypothetical protein